MFIMRRNEAVWGVRICNFAALINDLVYRPCPAHCNSRATQDSEYGGRDWMRAVRDLGLRISFDAC